MTVPSRSVNLCSSTAKAKPVDGVGRQAVGCDSNAHREVFALAPKGMRQRSIVRGKTLNQRTTTQAMRTAHIIASKGLSIRRGRIAQTETSIVEPKANRGGLCRTADRRIRRDRHSIAQPSSRDRAYDKPHIVDGTLDGGIPTRFGVRGRQNPVSRERRVDRFGARRRAILLRRPKGWDRADDQEANSGQGE